MAGPWIAYNGVPSEMLQKQCDAARRIQRVWKRGLSLRAWQGTNVLEGTCSPAACGVEKVCEKQSLQSCCNLEDVARTVTPFSGHSAKGTDDADANYDGNFFPKLRETMQRDGFCTEFAKLVGAWEHLEGGACFEEVRDTHEVARSFSPSRLVSVIAYGSIHCDNICDYLETFGKVLDLENQYSAKGRHVDVFSFEDAASADAAASSLTHYAPNDHGKSIRLEIRSESKEKM